MPELDNVAIARQLELMGDLLEIAGADKFRFLSYRKAANSIRAWPEQLSALADDGRLTEVPGIGKKLAASIEEMLHRGTFAELEEAKKAIPPGLVEVMDIPGVGPKRAKQFYDKLGVDSVGALNKMLDSGKLEKLGGMGAKSVENIRKGHAAYLAHHGRMLLMDALPLADRMVEKLEALPSVVRAVPAGSLRRMQETIGDIDIIVASDEPEVVMAAVRDLPVVAEVIASGATKTSVLTTSGPQVDVRVVRPDEFGAALQYFTGSKEHNVHLREIAKKRALKVNEYGVFRVGEDGSEGQRLGGASEDEVYRLLGMEVPPPEIRHDTGEIDAAEAHELPRLLESGDIRGDFHVHSSSTDSHSTIEENRAMASELGYEYVVVTDHAYDLRMVGGLSVEQLEEQWAHVDRLNAEDSGPVVLKGIELNIGADGGVDYGPDVLARFDLCVASLHSGWNEPAEVVTQRLLRAMENPFVDIIGHPTGRVIGRRDPLSLDMDAVLAKAAETGTIMEVNAYPDRLDLCDTHLRLARRLGVRIAIGTDAHRAEHMRYMRYGVATCRRGWISAEECLNAQPLDVVRSWLRRSR
ncbi:MAG: DNA polymerase/3'-5' exonuclease PolX [Coriobacteriia bacterium]|nr:DNA polymerase/3'-5' exonuclease PolX [Coriobacteriia bacterium]